MTIALDGGSIALDVFARFLDGKQKVAIAKSVLPRLKRARLFVEEKLESNEPFYGINTGFGMLANKRIPKRDLDLLQQNLILSHAVGVGEPFPPSIARLIMLLRANVLATGYSGIRPETLRLLVDMINVDIVPIIPQKGSVGASGDLAPLSHLALAMLGRGKVWYAGHEMTAKRALAKAGLKPAELHAKEGIALINGTQAMAAMGVAALVRLENLLRAADVAGALSIEGDRASRRPFDARIHRIRPHPGQIATAANIRKLIVGSRIIAGHAKCRRVQDPYSFRCIPQVSGAVKDAVDYARGVIMREVGSCTDNPLLFPEDGDILSGGNFHGEPLALAMDTMGMAVAELGSIAERRVAILTSPLSGELVTKFLTPKPGLNSGLMIAHVTMSSLVSENKVLAHPASVDSIPTSGGQEDHVSMGTISARKALEIIGNVEHVIAIEVFAACQAIDLQCRHGRPGKGTGAAYALVRKEVPPVVNDREFRFDIEACTQLVRSGELVHAAEKSAGPLKV